MSNVSNATNLLPKANEGFSSTLASTIAAGATTVPLTSTLGLTDGSTIVLIVEPKTAKEQVVTGKVHIASSSIINATWTKGNNVVHTGGSTVVDYVTSTHYNLITRHLAVEHTEQGAHKDIHATSVESTGPITGQNGLFITGGGITFPNASIPAAAIANPWWTELARVTLTQASESIVATFAGKRYLRVIINAGLTGGAGVVEECIRFNDDFGPNYSQTQKVVLPEANTMGVQYSKNDSKIDLSYSPQAFDGIFTILDIADNPVSNVKYIHSVNQYSGANAAAVDVPLEVYAHWVKSDPVINKITLFDASTSPNQYAIGSEMVVLGHD